MGQGEESQCAWKMETGKSKWKSKEEQKTPSGE
jgi:hypothetical protein